MATEVLQEESTQLGSRNEREVFLGDLNRRRPTKRQTTVRSFAIKRNWTAENEPQLNSPLKKASSSLQSTQVSSRISATSSTPDSEGKSNEPLSSQDIHPLVTTDGECHFPSVFDDNTPDLHSSLPGAALGTPVTPTKNLSTGSTDSLSGIFAGEDDDSDIVSMQKNTPKDNVLTPQAGLHSGPQSRRSQKSQKKVVTFKMHEKENIDDVHNQEYEAHNFVRLFNADRGRKRSVADVTDLDIVLTNVEEIALEMRNTNDSPLCKKVLREAFIQMRQIFSDSIDVYKERKYLKSATTKTNSKIKKMKQELIKVQAKRKRTQAKLEKLQSEYEELETLRRDKEDACSFLYEFESLQQQLRTAKPDRSRKQPRRNDNNLHCLLHEASGYLSVQQQLKNMNDKLERWVNENGP